MLNGINTTNLNNTPLNRHQAHTAKRHINTLNPINADTFVSSKNALKKQPSSLTLAFGYIQQKIEDTATSARKKSKPAEEVLLSSQRGQFTKAENKFHQSSKDGDLKGTLKALHKMGESLDKFGPAANPEEVAQNANKIGVYSTNIAQEIENPSMGILRNELLKVAILRFEQAQKIISSIIEDDNKFLETITGNKKAAEELSGTEENKASKNLSGDEEEEAEEKPRGMGFIWDTSANNPPAQSSGYQGSTIGVTGN